MLTKVTEDFYVDLSKLAFFQINDQYKSAIAIIDGIKYDFHNDVELAKALKSKIAQKNGF